MKYKILIVLTTIFAICCAIGFSACFLGGENSDKASCMHSYEYFYDEDYHQGVCLKCGETTEGKHTFSGNVCTVCGYTRNLGETVNGKTVSFNPDGGECDVKTKDFIPGEPMAGLPEPKKEGYKFICWEDAFGIEFNETSIMPNTTLSLKARWEKKVVSFEDEYVSFKPATEGKKQDEIFYSSYEGIHKYIYVELTSDDLGGVSKVGVENNLDLSQNKEIFQYSVKSGYTLLWYSGNWSNPNGAQMFTLNYGSNVQLLTVSEREGVLKRYLVDIYVKHDYYISLYKNIFEEEPYDKIRVIENEKFPSDTKPFDYGNGFKFDKRVYFNDKNGKYEQFPNLAISKNWKLYQTYKPLTLSADLDKGVLNEELSITPYTQYFTLPSPEKDGYDFLGWQLSNGKFITNIEGYAGENYISTDNYCETLKAVYAKKKMYYTFEDDTLQTFKTVPVVTYTDKFCTEILEIVYVPYDTDCVLPVKTVQDEASVFSGWKYYSKNNNGEYLQNATLFDFNRKITVPVAMFPETISGNGHSTIPLNAERTFGKQDTFTAYLPVADAYRLNISTTGSVKFTVSSAGNNIYAKSYTATVNSPQSVSVGCFGYELGELKNIVGYVTVKILSLSGTFTASINGVTAKTDGNTVKLTEDNTILSGEDLTIRTEKSRHALKGWYNGDELLSNDIEYTFTVPNECVIYKVEWIGLSITSNDANAGAVNELDKTYKVGEEVIIKANTNSGYTFTGWYDGSALLTNELVYMFKIPENNVNYTARWISCPVTISINNDLAGSIYGLPKISTVGQEVKVTAETNAGYTFTGWFNGETKLTDKLSYTFAMPNEPVIFIAKWILVSIEKNISLAGSVSPLIDTYITGDNATITADTYLGYTFVGWYNGETNLTDQLSYTFIMPAENITYTAKWEVIADLQYFKFTSTKTDCKLIGVSGIYYTANNIIIPDLVTDISDSAFDGCKNLIYNTYDNAYYLGNTNNPYFALIKAETTLITSCIINENTKIISSSAFKECYKLTNIVIPKGVISIGDFAFLRCRDLKNITVPSSVNSIGERAFSYSGIENITLPNGITYINKSMFYGCNSLISVDIPNSVNSIGENAFSLCSSLTNIIIPDGVTRIDNFAFSSCYGLSNITIPNSVSSIGDNAFSGCSGLTSISLSNNLISIGYRAFYHCTGLTSIIIPKSVKAISSGVFYDCSNLLVYCEAESRPSEWSSDWNITTNFKYLPVIWGMS